MYNMTTNSKIFNETLELFTWPDYTMVVFLLLISLVIGFYFGTIKGFKGTEDYLMGGRRMKIIPVTISLLASYISGISMLGVPTDTYLNGIDYVYVIIGHFIAAVIMNTIFLPVFYDLKLTSCYEYFEKRFDRKVRILGSVVFGINLMTWLAMVMYVCAITLNQVTNLNIHFITPVICLVCIVYTSMGGIKAVIWTDVFQSSVMLISLILMITKGTIDLGDFNTIITTNLESGSPSFDINPATKYTVWSLSIGASIFSLGTSFFDQPMLQRYLTLPSVSAARKAAYFFVLGMSVFVILAIYTGLLLYAHFYKCDPLSTKLVEKKDQLLPLFAMKTLSVYPGIPGIFVAGIVSASLSSFSTGLNSMAAVLIADYRTIYSQHPTSERKSAIIMKLTIIIFGTLCVCLVYLIEHLGAILQVYMSVGAITNGAIVGLFTAGVLFPCINKTGALVGGISSLTFMTWLCFKAQAAILSGELTYPLKKVRTDGCAESIRRSNVTRNETVLEENFKLYHISYLWYTLIAVLVTIICGSIVSFILREEKCVKTNLLAPILRRKDKNESYELAATAEMG